jgi:hypothetical protein
LTPPEYPAKLTRLQIYFGNASDELPVGHPITIVIGLHPRGTSDINGVVFQRIETNIAAVGTFNTLTLATPISITSGDVVIGFATRNPANVYPMAADMGPPLRQRSYIGTDGVRFSLVDAVSADLASNFPIRAIVELP